MNEHGPTFKEYVDLKRINKSQLARDLDMSKQNLYQLFKSREFQDETIKRIEKVLKVKWEAIEKLTTVNIAVNTMQEIKKPPTSEDEEGYKDKYIALLEQQLKDQARQLGELKDRMDARTLDIHHQIETLSRNLAVHDQTAKVALATAQTLYVRLQEHFARVEPKPTPVDQKALKRIADDMDTLLASKLEAAFQQDGGRGN